MTLWLFVFAPLIFVVAGWAWRYQHRVLRVTGTGLAQVAGRPGTMTDVQLTSVLVDGPNVLIGFQPACAAGHRPAYPVAQASRERLHLLVSLDADPQASIARLRRWQASGVSLVMWRDHGGDQVELSHVSSCQRIALSVIAHPVTTAPSRR